MPMDSTLCKFFIEGNFLFKLYFDTAFGFEIYCIGIFFNVKRFSCKKNVVCLAGWYQNDENQLWYLLVRDLYVLTYEKQHKSKSYFFYYVIRKKNLS